jgi:hypothetical protein
MPTGRMQRSRPSAGGMRNPHGTHGGTVTGWRRISDYISLVGDGKFL